jgi:hypothetical protein
MAIRHSFFGPARPNVREGNRECDDKARHRYFLTVYPMFNGRQDQFWRLLIAGIDFALDRRDLGLLLLGIVGAAFRCELC